MANVQRGLITRDDAAWWDGIARTSSRVDATGGTVTGLTFGEEIDILQVFGAGTSRTLAAINDAIARLSGANATLMFGNGTWVIDDNITIPSTVNCHVVAGCVFAVSAGKTLTFAGHVDIEYGVTWFSGAGTVVREQTLTGAGAVDLLTDITYLVTTSTDALTLADGYEGQEKTIVMKTDGGDGTLTPDNYANGTTIIFTAVGDSVRLLFTNSSWHLVGFNSAENLPILDALGLITASNVEAALAEIMPRLGVTKHKTAAQSKNTDTTLADDTHLKDWDLVAAKSYAIDGFIEGIENGGDLKMAWAFGQTPVSSGWAIQAVDASGTTEADFSTAMTVQIDITTMLALNQYGLYIKGWVRGHATVAGTMSMQWAQKTSNGNNTTLSERSWVTVRQLD